jgi:hypothetical protein
MRWNTDHRHEKKFDRYEAILDAGCAASAAKLTGQNSFEMNEPIQASQRTSIARKGPEDWDAPLCAFTPLRPFFHSFTANQHAFLFDAAER